MQFGFLTFVSDGTSRFIICLPAGELGDRAFSVRREKAGPSFIWEEWWNIEIHGGGQDNKVVACSGSQPDTRHEFREGPASSLSSAFSTRHSVKAQQRWRLLDQQTSRTLLGKRKQQNNSSRLTADFSSCFTKFPDKHVWEHMCADEFFHSKFWLVMGSVGFTAFLGIGGNTPIFFRATKLPLNFGVWSLILILPFGSKGRSEARAQPVSVISPWPQWNSEKDV